jgi:hypothetical protein
MSAKAACCRPGSPVTLEFLQRTHLKCVPQFIGASLPVPACSADYHPACLRACLGACAKRAYIAAFANEGYDNALNQMSIASLRALDNSGRKPRPPPGNCNSTTCKLQQS